MFGYPEIATKNDIWSDFFMDKRHLLVCEINKHEPFNETNFFSQAHKLYLIYPQYALFHI